MNKLIHKILHIIGRNRVDVITWKEEGFIHFGLKCKGCESIKTIEKIPFDESENIK
jgi:hypothetical protein